MQKFEEYIHNFDIYNDEEEKERIINRCIADFTQLKHYKNLKIDIDYTYEKMDYREDEVKKSFDIEDVFKNTANEKSNFFKIGLKE